MTDKDKILACDLRYEQKQLRQKLAVCDSALQTWVKDFTPLGDVVRRVTSSGENLTFHTDAFLVLGNLNCQDGFRLFRERDQICVNLEDLKMRLVGLEAYE